MKPVLMSAPPAAAAPPPVADAPRPRVAHKPRAALMWSSLNGLAAVVLPFVVFACFARLMMPRQFAMIGLALAALEMLKTLAPQGLYDVLVTHDEGEREYHAAAAAILLASAVAVMGLFTALLLCSQAVFAMDMPGVVYLLALKVLFDLALLQPQAAMVRRAEIRRLSTRSLLSGVVGATCGIPLAWAGAPMAGLVAFYVMQSFATWLATVWGAKAMVMPRFHRAAARDMLGQGLRASGVRVAAGANNYLDQLLIGHLFSAIVVGMFNLGKRIEIVSVTISASLSQIMWQPAFAMQGESARASAMARGVAGVALVCGVPICVFAVSSPVAVPFLFGRHWAGAAPVAAALALAGLVRALGSVAGAALTVTKRNGPLLWLSIGGGVANVVLVTLVARFGMMATAAVICLRAVAQSAIMYALLAEVRRQMLPVMLRNFVLPLALATAASWLVSGWAMRWLAGISLGHDLLYLLVVGAAGALVSVPLLIRKI
ncbi:MAG TPA: oligosaccharide flippase family protein [Novosphingobium sp.]|nr:oligosaccharide flippase family protein [Novosphingobium sp.]